MGTMTDGFVVGTGGGVPIDLPGWSMLVKVGASSTGGALTAVHGRIAPGHPGPAEHVHDGHDEIFVVLDGTLRFRLDDRYTTVVAGDVVFAPRGLAHGFSNPSETPATYLAMVTPSGYERYFEQLAEHFRRTGDLPGPTTTDDWMAALDTRRAAPLPPASAPVIPPEGGQR